VRSSPTATSIILPHTQCSTNQTPAGPEGQSDGGLNSRNGPV